MRSARSRISHWNWGVAVVVFMGPVTAGRALVLQVNGGAGLRQAFEAARPGTRIMLAPGRYEGGFHARGLKGTKGNPITIEASDPKNPPVFAAAEVGLHLASPEHLELEGLVFEGLSANGLNIDDTAGGAARHVVISGLRFRNIGSRGNHDALKLSGVDDFRVSDSTFDGWGTGGGSAIDMVGCHRGAVEGCTFGGTDSTESNGVQAKGGSSQIRILGNAFRTTGGRGVNLGGHTGTPFFRPALLANGNAEARDVRVEGNTFIGTQAPVVFAGVDGAVVRFNAFENPGRWVIRILQENTGPGFVPCRNGDFSDNRIVFQSATWSEGGVNVGGGTAPETFVFAKNWWHCSDRPDRSRPRLPTAETDGEYGRGPTAGKHTAGSEAWRPIPEERAPGAGSKRVR